MSDNTNELDNIIVLNDEEGNEVEFEFLDLIDYQDNQYVVLLPCSEEDDEVVILRAEINENEENFTSIDDEEILMNVFEIFKEKFKDEFNFVD